MPRPGTDPGKWDALPAACHSLDEAGRDPRLARLSKRGLLPLFPLGTDFGADEQRLVAALLWLKGSFSPLGMLGAQPRPQDLPLLARMGLAQPRGLRERLLRRVVVVGLRRTSD